MADDGLRREVEAAVLKAIRAAGPRGRVMFSHIVRQFEGRGVGRSTLYAWCQAIQRSYIATRPDVSTEPPEPAAPHDAGVEARELAAAVVPAAEEPAGPMGRALPILRHLQQTIEDVLRVRSTAFHADGRVRNSRMVLKAAEEMRRSLETVVKLQQAMNDQAALERFHAAILDVIREEDPLLAQRVMKRLDDLALRWGG